MTIFYAYSFGGFIHISSFTISGIPNWLIWLISFILVDALLPGAPILGMILLIIFWMITCMLDIGGMRALTGGEMPDITPNTPMHHFASITTNVVNLLFSVGAFLFCNSGWSLHVLDLLLLSQIARLGWYLLGLITSFLTKWLGTKISSLCGTIAYMVGFVGYIYWLTGAYDGFTMLFYGLSQIIGGGLR